VNEDAGSRRRQFTRGWGWALLTILVAAAVGGTGVWWHAAGGGALSGTVPNPPIQIYDFLLTDQDGHAVSLASLRGRAVVLTFLYVHCPDVCPVIADNLHHTYDAMGSLRPRVTFVAVSVDPHGDTPAAVREFLAVHHVQGTLTYLTGSYAQLRPIWIHYYVESQASAAALEATETTAGTSPTPVGHTAIVYLIDPRGSVRAFLGSDFSPQELARDLRILTTRVGI